MCAMLKISSGRRHMGYIWARGRWKPPTRSASPCCTPLTRHFVTVLPGFRPCTVLSYCRLDGCWSTTRCLLVCAMLKIASGRRHMGAGSMEGVSTKGGGRTSCAWEDQRFFIPCVVSRHPLIVGVFSFAFLESSRRALQHIIFFIFFLARHFLQLLLNFLTFG